MLPSEAYQLQLGFKSQNRSPVDSFVGSSYKSNPFQNHQLFRQACYQTKDLYSKDLIKPICRSFNFSINEDFFVAGAVNSGKVALWNTTQFLVITNKLKPIYSMDYDDSDTMINIFTSPDDLRIVSNGLFRIAILDIQMRKLICHINRDRDIPSYGVFCGLSVQPQNDHGNIIATCQDGGFLQIVDIRRSKNDAVIRASRRSGRLCSVAFSPVDESLVALAGSEIGTEIVDLRNPQLPVRSFPIPNNGLHFHGQGTRLLCIEDMQPGLSLYDLKSDETTPFMRLTAPGFRAPNSFAFAEMSACFTDKSGELVIGSCKETGRAYIWSTNPGPYHHHNGQVQPLLSLKHEGCKKVRYNESTCTLLTQGKNMKVWTPVRLPESISSNSGVSEDTSSCSDLENSEMSIGSGEEEISNEAVDDSYVPSIIGRWRVM